LAADKFTITNDCLVSNKQTYGQTARMTFFCFIFIILKMSIVSVCALLPGLWCTLLVRTGRRIALSTPKISSGARGLDDQKVPVKSFKILFYRFFYWKCAVTA